MRAVATTSLLRGSRRQSAERRQSPRQQHSCRSWCASADVCASSTESKECSAAGKPGRLQAGRVTVPVSSANVPRLRR